MNDKKANPAEAEFLKETDDGGYTVDMTAVPEAKNEVLPKAWYTCVIDEIEYKLSQSSGKPMWAAVYIISEGEYEGRKLFHNISFSEGALPYTKKNLMKLKPEILTSDFRPDRLDDYDLQGMTLQVKTKVGKDQNNEPRTEVADIKAAADSSAFMGAETAEA